MSVISYGKEKPIEQGDSEAAYAKNRRANFVPVQQ
jgi:peptidoglycan-associated lipoprotein